MKPNLIFMVSDQHRWDWMGHRGVPFIDTPHLDGLAARGARCDNACCNAPLCGPSRMSMLTGRHPYRNDVWINEHPLASDVPTYAHALAMAGYQTVLAGRMHFAGPDQNHGFHERLTGDITRCYWGGPMTDFGPHEGSAAGIGKALAPGNLGPGHYNPVNEYDRAVTRDAVAFLDAYAGRGDGKPLMMTVGWYAPHHPFMAEEEDYRWVEARWPDDDAPVPVGPEQAHPWVAGQLRKCQYGKTPADVVRRARINYAALIRGIDRHVGRVLEAARRLPGDTIVVYTSDHGEMAGDHGLWGKTCFYDASVNVPLLFANLDAPTEPTTPRIAAGARLDVPVSLLDIAPTLIAMAGGPPLPIADGQTLAPLLTDPTADVAAWRDRPVYAELEIWLDEPIRMVRRGRYKCSYYHNAGGLLLFDLAADPEERHNLADDPAQASLCDELRSLILQDWDPDAIHRRQVARMSDLQYLAPWGREVGMGQLGLWDQPPPPWRR